MVSKPSWIYILLSATLLLSGCSLPQADLTFEEASVKVVEDVVRPEQLDDELIVFGLSDPLQPGDRLEAYRPPALLEEGAEGRLIEVETESWFFWIDDYPGARFAHPNRFVLVESGGGAVQIIEESWWPLLNGQGLWVDEQEYWDEDQWVFTNLSWRPNPTRSNRESETVQGKWPAGIHAVLPREQYSLQESGVGSAIVINGWSTGESLQEDFEVDADHMHDIYQDLGFDTTYLGPTQDSNPDRDGENSLDEIGKWFWDQRERLKPSQTLFVYITGHGFVSGESGDGFAGGVSEDLLEIWLKLFDPGVHIVVIVDSCYSGSFIDTLQGVADLIITSTNATDPSYGDIDPEGDPNPEDTGGEFTSGFVEDWNLILDDPVEVQKVQDRASREGESFWEALAALSSVTAIEKDAGAITGKSFPMVAHGLPATRQRWTPTPTQPPAIAAGGQAVYQAQSAVGEDQAGHDPFIDMPEEFELKADWTANEITFSADSPWVDVSGSLQEGKFFEAQGIGVVAGFSDIQVEFTGELLEGGVVGEYVMGVGGGLPQGAPISYEIAGDEVEPPTTGPTAEADDVGAFYDSFNQAFDEEDVDSLHQSLHPAVFDLYGEEACYEYLSDVIMNPTQVQVLEILEYGPWDWEIDGESITIDPAYSVLIEVTAGGQTVERTAHLAPLEDGTLAWFTDCGEPMQVVVETTPSPEPSATETPLPTSTMAPASRTPTPEAAKNLPLDYPAWVWPVLLLCCCLLGLSGVGLGFLFWRFYRGGIWPTHPIGTELVEDEPIEVDSQTYQLKTEKQCDKPCYEIRAVIRRPHRIRIKKVEAFTLHKSTGAVLDSTQVPGEYADSDVIMEEFGKHFDVPEGRNEEGKEFLYRDGKCDDACMCVVPEGTRASATRRTSRRFVIVFVKELVRVLNKPFIDPQTGQETQHPDMMSEEEVQRYLPESDLLLPRKVGEPFRVVTKVRYEATLRVPVELRKYDGRCVPIKWDPSVGRA